MAAHDGFISAGSDCDRVVITVSLNNNVTADREVEIVSTLPGYPGLTGHYDTTGNSGPVVIWTVVAHEPIAGTVDLYIRHHGEVEFHDWLGVQVPTQCPTETMTPTPTPTATPRHTPTPSTSTVPPATGTPHVVVTPPITSSDDPGAPSTDESLVVLALGALIVATLILTPRRRAGR